MRLLGGLEVTEDGLLCIRADIPGVGQKWYAVSHLELGGYDSVEELVKAVEEKEVE